MEREVRKKLIEDLRSNMNTYADTLSADDEGKGKALNVITKEVKLLNEDEDHKMDLKIKKTKLDLETIKLDLDRVRIELESKRYDLEASRVQNQIELEQLRLELDQRRFELERIKLERDEKVRLEDSEKSKWDKFINMGLRVLEIGLPLAINTALVMMNFRLIYADDGRVPSEMKDLMKNVYRGK